MFHQRGGNVQLLTALAKVLAISLPAASDIYSAMSSLFSPGRGVCLRFGVENKLAVLLEKRCALVPRERRCRKRYALKLPLSVRPSGNLAAGEILTECKDVSSRGVYFFLQQPVNMDAGSPLEIMLTLPSEITGGEPVRVRCEARVQRKETVEKGRVGIAVKIERYRFLPGKRRRAG
ncbi:MAG: hypothetical protein DMG32_09505 [Acidobacteria bacterium]|nr:MAG: hypothetical protein DMG32_09505 [Acidobacteriota bacterium]